MSSSDTSVESIIKGLIEQENRIRATRLKLEAISQQRKVEPEAAQFKQSYVDVKTITDSLKQVEHAIAIKAAVNPVACDDYDEIDLAAEMEAIWASQLAMGERKTAVKVAVYPVACDDHDEIDLAAEMAALGMI